MLPPLVSWWVTWHGVHHEKLVKLITICLVISLTSYNGLEVIQHLCGVREGFLTCISLPSSIGQSIRLKQGIWRLWVQPSWWAFFFHQCICNMGFTTRRLVTICLQISIGYQPNKLRQTWINIKHLCGVREALLSCKAHLAQLDRASDSNAWNLKAVSSTLTVGLFLSQMYK